MVASSFITIEFNGTNDQLANDAFGKRTPAGIWIYWREYVRQRDRESEQDSVYSLMSWVLAACRITYCLHNVINSDWAFSFSYKHEG